MNLTKRQSDILKAIIEEYIENAEPVASVQLVESRGFNVCGATIRNIMADLVRKGYLQMVHVSSGREPTEIAYRYYISELMEEADLDVLAEVALKQRIWNEKYDLERLLRDTVKAMSDTTQNMAFALTSDGFSIYSGASKLLNNPEFYELESTRSVLRFADDYELQKSLLEKNVMPGSITVLIGREIGLASMNYVSIIATYVDYGNRTGYLGILGPSRQYYNKVIPIVRRARDLLQETLGAS